MFSRIQSQFISYHRSTGSGVGRNAGTTRFWTALVLAVAGVLLGAAPSFAGAGWVYTADEKGSTISVIDLASETVGTLKLPVSPHNVQVSDDGRFLLAAGVVSTHGASHAKGDPGRLLVYDLQDLSRSARIDVPIGPHPAHVIADRQGLTAFVSDSAEDAVYVVDLARGAVAHKIATGRYPHGLRPSPDGREVYVANVKDGTVSVIDVVAGREAARILVGKSPVQVGFTPDGKQAYVSLNAENAVAVVDTATRQVVGKVAVGRNPVQVFATPDGSFVYVANQGSEAKPADTVTVIDTASRSPVATLKTGNGAHGVVASTSGDRVFVSNIVDNSVSVIDVAARKVVRTIKVGKGPNGITYRD